MGNCRGGCTFPRVSMVQILGLWRSGRKGGLLRIGEREKKHEGGETFLGS